jgi:glycosyltransferase involved in cell wall biosynthesis
VIPVFNRELLISDAIQSVQRQSYQDWELCIVDDGSTDDTGPVIQSAAEQDRRIRAVGGSHRGVSEARNTALDLPGDYRYVAFLDSDDVWLSHHLSCCMEFLESHPQVAATFARFDTRDESGSWSEARLRERDARTRRPLQYAVQSLGSMHILDQEGVHRACLRSELALHPSTLVVRRDAVADRWFNPDLLILEDCELTIRLSKRAVLAFDEQTHTRVRYHGDNLTGSINFRTEAGQARCRSWVAFNQWKLDQCSRPEDSKRVRRELTEANYLLGQCLSETSQLGPAMRAYVESLRHSWSALALKGLLGAAVRMVAVHVQRRSDVGSLET